MLANYRAISKTISEHRKELELMKVCIGKLQMYTIIYHATNRRLSIANLMAKCTNKYSSVSLMEFTINSKKYQVSLSNLANKVAGEYDRYEDIVGKYGEFTPEIVEQLDTLDKIIIENAKAVFASLPQNIKDSNPGFNMITRSEEKRYLYYYESRRKKSFTIIFTEI